MCSTASTGVTPTAWTAARGSACSSWPPWPGPSVGSASVDTAVGQGSTFEVVLPAFPGECSNGNGNGRRHRVLASIDRGTGPAARAPPRPARHRSVLGPADRLLAPDFRVLAPDRIGYGRPAGEARGLAANADLVAAFIRERRAAPATVVAHSWSGGAAVHAGRPAPYPGPGSGAGGAACTPDSLNALDRWLTVPGVGRRPDRGRPGGDRRGAAPGAATHGPATPRPATGTSSPPPCPRTGVLGGRSGLPGPPAPDLHDRAAGPQRRDCPPWSALLGHPRPAGGRGVRGVGPGGPAPGGRDAWPGPSPAPN